MSFKESFSNFLMMERVLWWKALPSIHTRNMLQNSVIEQFFFQNPLSPRLTSRAIIQLTFKLFTTVDLPLDSLKLVQNRTPYLTILVNDERGWNCLQEFLGCQGVSGIINKYHVLAIDSKNPRVISSLRTSWDSPMEKQRLIGL